MSNYPERPVGGKRPPRPGVSRHKSSSERRTSKARVWFQAPASPEASGPRPKEARIDTASCVNNHSNPALESFLKKYRANRVPFRPSGSKDVYYS